MKKNLLAFLKGGKFSSKVMLIALGVVILSFIGGTYAVFTDKENASSEFHAAKVNITIEEKPKVPETYNPNLEYSSENDWEWDDPPEPEDVVVTIYNPFDTDFTKAPFLTNNSPIPVKAHIKLSFKINDEIKTYAQIQDMFGGAEYFYLEGFPKGAREDVWKKESKDSDDFLQYYYYISLLPGKSTDKLFTKLHIDGHNQLTQLFDLKIILSGYFTQTDL